MKLDELDKKEIAELTESISKRLISVEQAWQLFEDMPHNTKFLFYHDVYAKWRCGLDWNRCVMEDCRVKAWGDSAYDAICNAFLAWRRNKNNESMATD